MATTHTVNCKLARGSLHRLVRPYAPLFAGARRYCGARLQPLQQTPAFDARLVRFVVGAMGEEEALFLAGYDV